MGLTTKSYFYLRVAWIAVTHLMNWFLLCWKSKAIVLFGETKEKLAEAAKKANIETILFAENVQTAVTIAFDYSEKDDTILTITCLRKLGPIPEF